MKMEKISYFHEKKQKNEEVIISEQIFMQKESTDEKRFLYKKKRLKIQNNV